MELLIQFIISVVLCLIYGFVIYLFALNVVGWIVPQKHIYELFKIVPFFPKFKYAVLLYFLSGLLYLIISREVLGYIPKIASLETFIIIPFCIIASSQVIRAIAKYRKENLEETQEEEVKRKQNT